MKNKYGYCKGISKRTEQEIRGYYACLPYSTYCFKEDYEARPDNDKDYVITTVPGDWGLPNDRKVTEIEPGSMKRYIGTDKNGNEVFEDDFVKWEIVVSGEPVTIHSYLFYGEWRPQVHSPNNNLSMWNEEREIWLDECELVVEEK